MLVLGRLRASSVNGDVKEKSDDVYEMSVSGGCFEPEVVLGCKVVQDLSKKADG